MAQYIEGSDRYQPMLLPAAVDDYVSSASPVRAIDAFVDSLDLPALGLKTRNDFSDGARLNFGPNKSEQTTMDGAPSDESPAYRHWEL